MLPVRILLSFPQKAQIFLGLFFPPLRLLLDVKKAPPTSPIGSIASFPLGLEHWEHITSGS